MSPSRTTLGPRELDHLVEAIESYEKPQGNSPIPQDPAPTSRFPRYRADNLYFRPAKPPARAEPEDILTRPKPKNVYVHCGAAVDVVLMFFGEKKRRPCLYCPRCGLVVDYRDRDKVSDPL